MFRSVTFVTAFLFVPGELSAGGHGGPLSSVASWLFINLILASLHWSLTSARTRFTNPGRMSWPDVRDPCKGVLPGVQTHVTPEWDCMPG